MACLTNHGHSSLLITLTFQSILTRENSYLPPVPHQIPRLRKSQCQTDSFQHLQKRVSQCSVHTSFLLRLIPVMILSLLKPLNTMLSIVTASDVLQTVFGGNNTYLPHNGVRRVFCKFWSYQKKGLSTSLVAHYLPSQHSPARSNGFQKHYYK